MRFIYVLAIIFISTTALLQYSHKSHTLSSNYVMVVEVVVLDGVATAFTFTCLWMSCVVANEIGNYRERGFTAALGFSNSTIS